MIESSVHQAKTGKMARLRLNNPGKLNALNLELLLEAHRLLQTWNNDEDIDIVWIDGHGEKAFCAGGDITSLMARENETAAELRSRIQRFFSIEYQLDYLIHTLRKPTIIWGNGYDFGGGLGIFRGGDIRIVTENSSLSMPEVLIGLYPDVAASWFLNKLPQHLGLLIGMCGIRLNSTDALDLGLATHGFHPASQENVMGRILDQPLRGNALERALECLEELSGERLFGIPSKVLPHNKEIRELFVPGLPIPTLKNLLEYSGDTPIIKSASHNLKKGSYLSARLTWKHFYETSMLSLQECFSRDLILATNCACSKNFKEGVRALLIDKDGTPNWEHNSAEELSDELLDTFFTTGLQLGTTTRN